MKKLLILALVLAPAVASAQETANVGVSTSIQAAFALTTADSLVFGAVQSLDAVSITSQTGATSNAGNSAKRGKVTTDATNALVYTVPATIVLPRTVGTLGDANLTVTLNYSIRETSPITYTSGTSTGSTTAAGNTLWIGGSFTAPGAASVGNTYSGTITLTAVYL